MKYPRRLIEVDLPIRRISDYSLSEKNVRKGRISDLHIWWARRPQAACRAILCAALWPDPVDEFCPTAFREAALRIMIDFAQEAMNDRIIRDTLLSKITLSKVMTVNQASSIFGTKNPNTNSLLRYFLLDFIADFANWNASNNSLFIRTARALTQAAHESLGNAHGTRPLVADPFAGGGSIPMEALRIGADAFASDLNPVPVLINKVLIEYLPKFGKDLTVGLRSWAKWAKHEIKRDLGRFFPDDANSSEVFTYLWARTIKCEGPGCGVEIPLLKNLWLVKKNRGSVAVKLEVTQKTKRIDFKIIQNATARDVGKETIRRGAVTCPCCGFTTPVTSVRKQLGAKHGGSSDARLYAVVTNDINGKGKKYRLPTEIDYKAYREACDQYNKLKKSNPDIFPNESLPKTASGYFAPPTYGAQTFSDLFNPRQLLCAHWFVQSFDTWYETSKIAENIKEPLRCCIAFVISRMIDSNSSQCLWITTHGETVMRTFGRQAYPIVWDFAEINPTGVSSRGVEDAADIVAVALETTTLGVSNASGTSVQCSAEQLPLPDDSCQAIITDPPYYNAIPYADLADFYQVWLSRLFRGTQLNFMSESLSPKSEEIVEMASWDLERYAYKTSKWYEQKMQEALKKARYVLAPSGIMVLVFAHKQTSAWEALISAVINAGWIITGSWPIDTENARRLRAQSSAALASSIHLACRPRETKDGSLNSNDIGDWRDVLSELPKRIHEWMPRLAQEGIVGADAIFACLGPALEIFSRYSSVEKTSGEKVSLNEYLEQVWAAIAREALNMIFQGADASGFDEDARLTAMWLWTLRAPVANDHAVEDEGSEESEEEGNTKSTIPGFSLEYDAARKIAQGLGVHLESLGNLIEIKGETAVLLPVAARTRYLFGIEATQSPSPRRRNAGRQLTFDFAQELEDVESEAGILSGNLSVQPGVTVLDQLHQSMILFAAGRGEALKRFLVDEGVGQNPLLWRLAQALSALYPASSEEKRWVDGVMARKKGLGL